MHYRVSNGERLQLIGGNVYINQIDHDVGLWDSDVMFVSPTFVLVPCDLIIPRCIFQKKIWWQCHVFHFKYVFE